PFALFTAPQLEWAVPSATPQRPAFLPPFPPASAQAGRCGQSLCRRPVVQAGGAGHFRYLHATAGTAVSGRVTSPVRPAGNKRCASNRAAVIIDLSSPASSAARPPSPASSAARPPSRTDRVR